jgi:hypothetical protein
MDAHRLAPDCSRTNTAYWMHTQLDAAGNYKHIMDTLDGHRYEQHRCSARPEHTLWTTSYGQQTVAASAHTTGYGCWRTSSNINKPLQTHSALPGGLACVRPDHTGHTHSVDTAHQGGAGQDDTRAAHLAYHAGAAQRFSVAWHRSHWSGHTRCAHWCLAISNKQY